MRILFLNPTGVLGGAERALLAMVASLREEFPLAGVAAILGGSGALAEELAALGANVQLLPLPHMLAVAGDAGAGGPAGSNVSRWRLIARLAGASPATGAYLLRLVRRIGQIAPDLIHTNGFKMHLLGAWAAPRNVPVIWHLHDFVSLRPVMRRLLSHSLGRCSGIIANSHSVTKDILATLGRQPATETIYNAIDLEEFNPVGSPLDLDALAGLPPATPGTIRIGLVATTARWKGHDVFLRALSMLGERSFRGYVIGAPIYCTEGSQYSIAQLQEITKKAHLDGRVGFAGFVREMAAAMRTLDIVVHASVAPEPFGLAIAEAFASGRPVVAARAGGVQEMIKENQNGLAYEPGDSAELAALLTSLMADPKLRSRLGSAARQTAEVSFTHRRLAADLMRFYSKALPAN